MQRRITTPFRRRTRELLFAGLVASFGVSDAAAFEGLSESENPRFSLMGGGVRLTLEGEAELELHDLQGRGGRGNDSPTDRRTLGTRSPFVELDSFTLAVGIWFSDTIRAHIQTIFGTQGAQLTGVWLDAKLRGPSWLQHEVQLGMHPPIVYRERRTERYPLIATAFWREPEVHLSYGAIAHTASSTTTFGPSASLQLSLGIMRPVSFASVQDSRTVRGTINIIAYGQARPFSGNSPVFGGQLRADWLGAFVEAFGFVGALSAEAGTDALRSTLTRFSDLPGYNASDPELQSRTFMWGGGRLGFERFGVHALVEVIATQESLLRRYGGYVQLSYVLSPFAPNSLFHRFEPLIRYERMRIRDADSVQSSGRALRSPAPSEAPTWDFDVFTAALSVHVYEEMVRLRAEYAWVKEYNGVEALLLADAPLRNDELLLQLEIGF